MYELSLQDQFLRLGLITQDQLRIAEKETQLTGLGLEQALLSTGFISQSVLRDFRSHIVGKDAIELAGIDPPPQVLDMISPAVARCHIVLPLAYSADNNTLCVAMERAHDVLAMDCVAAEIDVPPQLDIKLASRADILDAIDRLYGTEVSIDSLLNTLDQETTPSQARQGDDHCGVAVQLVEALLEDAVRCGASDIHFEPEASYLRIRYRVDGVLRQVKSIHKYYWPTLSVRIKVLSSLNIAESRAPQDGRFAQMISGRDIDFRVSCFPSVHGENIVIRLLDRSAQLMDVSQLGLPAVILDSLRRSVKKPSGLIIMSGPTGSGKSTTLYSVLNEIRDESINIVTMEDPVEFSVPLLRQCSVNQSVKLDFASGIRSILRQDPDVILVGETRDQATAEMVVRAALTGHLVLTTLHSQTALGSLSRLEDLGLNLSHLAGHILALVSQRLVRKLCESCKRSVSVPQYLQPYLPQTSELYEAQGCGDCSWTGYRGRQAVVECYRPSAELNTMLASGCSVGALLDLVSAENHESLAVRGMVYVSNGTTSLQELSREIDLDGLMVLE